MVWTALLAGGLSLLSGLGSQKSAKKQAKTQAANDYIANLRNEAAIAATNDYNQKLGKKLGKKLVNSKLVTTEHTQGSVTTNRASGQDNYSYVDTDAMMAAAEKAGFNPATFLAAGGMQAYTQTGWTGYDTQQEITDLLVTSTSKGHNAAAGYQLQAGLMSPQTFQMTSSQAQNIPDALSVVGDAGTAALNAYRTDAARQSNQDFQRELLNTQLSAIAKGQKANRNFYVPTSSTSGSTTVGGGGGLSASPTLGRPTPFEKGDVSVTNPWLRHLVDPTKSDAESIEARYGEVASEFFGAANLINDGVLNLTGKTIPGWGKAVKDYVGGLGIKFNFEEAAPPLHLTIKAKP